MGKKNKKLSTAIESRRLKKKSSSLPEPRNNPFEVRLNRLKHDVIGKKVKSDKGLPGVSRSKANEKRKKTLLKEYKQRFKNNVIIDRRFGEFDDSITAEEKMLKRFTLEKQKHHEKSGLYNLEDDDEELTHFGQSLSTINNFDDGGLQMSEDEDERINADNHFGGFLQKKNLDENEHQDDYKRKMSKQEIMDEVVANAKKKKYERQQTQEQAFELTQQLDTQWNEVRSLLVKRDDRKSSGKKEVDDYDRTVNELIFEAKGQPSERMKSEEQLAKEEKYRLQKLEKERLLRMLGDDEEEEEENTEHLSADAIIETKKKKDSRYEVRYHDGKMIIPEGEEDFFGLTSKNDDEKESEEEMDSSDEENESESDNDDIYSDNDDIEEDEESDDESAKIQQKLKLKKKEKSKKKDTKELPSSYKDPVNLEEFLTFVDGRNNDEILVILARIKKCHNIKLDNKNKQKIEKLFEILLDYIDHMCKQSKPQLKLINTLASFMYEVVQDIPSFSAKLFQNKLKNIEKKIIMRMKVKGSNGMFPTLKELVFFKVLSVVYPTSDLNHVVTTPCLFLMAVILNKAHFLNVKDIISGLFLLNVTLDYIKLSKRFLPEIITFIAKLLYQCSVTKTPMKKISCSILNLQKTEKNFLLIDTKRKENNVIHPLNISKTLGSSVEPSLLETDSIRLSCIHNMLGLTKQLCELYKDLSTYSEIFEPCASLLERLPVKRYPGIIKNLHREVLDLMSSASDKKRTFLTLQARKPIPLPMFNPSFDENYEVRSKKRAGDKNQNEVEKLKYKLKKEAKGAMREIRKDTHFLAKEQLKETIDRDSSRRKKVRELEQSIATERHDIKEMDKASGKRK